jgi:hypothetical protein
MRYRAIRELYRFHKTSLVSLASIAGVSPRGFYDWKDNDQPTLNCIDLELAEVIKKIHRRFPFFGANRIQQVLKTQYHKEAGVTKIKRYLNDIQSPTRMNSSRRFITKPLELKNIKNLLLKKGHPYFKVKRKNQV